jgi:hypothetical protein
MRVDRQLSLGKWFSGLRKERLNRGKPASVRTRVAIPVGDGEITVGDLTSFWTGLKYRKFPAKFGSCKRSWCEPVRIYEGNRRHQTPQQRRIMNQCKHPRVQIVSRDEDTEYVECLECREVFESSEFKDMAIEERTPAEES